jgi:hypothetical protein
VTKLPLPIKGLNKGITVSVTPSEYSTNMNNVRPRDVLEGRIRLGQRPGLAKWSTDQVGATEQPVVALCSVSSIT